MPYGQQGPYGQQPPPPHGQWQQTPQPQQHYGGRPQTQPQSRPQAQHGEPEYFGDGGYQPPQSFAPYTNDNNPGHTQQFSVGEAPDAYGPQGGYDDAPGRSVRRRRRLPRRPDDGTDRPPAALEAAPVRHGPAPLGHVLADA